MSHAPIAPIRIGISAALGLSLSNSLTYTSIPQSIMSEVYNANPTIVAVSKSSKVSSKSRSIWMDDFDAPSDLSDDDEVEPIDSDEIFGLSSFLIAYANCLTFLFCRPYKKYNGPRTSLDARTARRCIGSSSRGRQQPRPSRVHANSTPLWDVRPHRYAILSCLKDVEVLMFSRK